ncbi:MAG: hypothetical protein Q9195_007917 [Heterodermia aff. obscurata]
MLEHHRRMHEQTDSQNVRDVSSEESNFTEPDTTIHGDETSTRLAKFPTPMHQFSDVDKAHVMVPSVDQAVGYTADITASIQNDEIASNTTLNALRTEVDRLQRAKARAMRDFDQEINDARTALKVEPIYVED